MAANTFLSLPTPSCLSICFLPSPPVRIDVSSPPQPPRPGRTSLVPHFISCPFVCLLSVGHLLSVPVCYYPVSGCLSSPLRAQRPMLLGCQQGGAKQGSAAEEWVRLRRWGEHTLPTLCFPFFSLRNQLLAHCLLITHPFSPPLNRGWTQSS